MSFEVKIYKTNEGLFQTKFFDPKTGRRKRKKFETLKDARIYKTDMEARLKNKGLAAFSDLRVSHAIQGYLEKFPNSHIRSRKNHFADFVDKFGSHRVSELNTNDLRQWMDQRKAQGNLSEKTMIHIRSQFFGLFDSLLDEDSIRTNPMEKIRFRRHDNPRRPRVIMSVDEVLQVLKNARTFSPNILHPYLYTIAHTGARRGEILKLNRDDVDFKTGLIHLKQTKNGKERFVRMAKSLSDVIAGHLAIHKGDRIIVNDAGLPLGGAELSKTLVRFKAHFPIYKNWGCHSMRHSFAYNFLKKKGEMYQLQAILGHRAIQTTIDLYGQLQAQDIEHPSPYELEFEPNK